MKQSSLAVYHLNFISNPGPIDPVEMKGFITGYSDSIVKGGVI